MITEATPVKSSDGFEERTAPELLKWEKPGTQMTGIFRSLEEVELTDPDTKQKKNAWQYILEAENGNGSVKFFGTFDLLQKLTRKDLGRVVRITFTGLDESVVKNGNAMKVFTVFVRTTKAKAEPNAHGLDITDKDIPF